MVAPAGVYFRTSRSQWNDYVLPVYALSGAAGLPGVVCDLLEIADLAPASGAGIAFLVPGGLFELAFPLLLIVRELLWPERCPPRARQRGRGGLAVTTRRSRTSAQVTAVLEPSSPAAHRVGWGFISLYTLAFMSTNLLFLAPCWSLWH